MFKSSHNYVHALGLRAAEGAVLQPAGIAFDGHEGGNERTGIEEAGGAIDVVAQAVHG